MSLGLMLHELRERALSHRDDEAAHLAYARCLSGLGDEHGDFIEASVKGELRTPSCSLHQRLVGRLQGLMVDSVFDKGFLREITLCRGNGRAVRALVGLPEWRGVERVRLAHAGRHWRPSDARIAVAPYVELLAAPACSQVARVEHLPWRIFVGLCELDRRFDCVSICGPIGAAVDRSPLPDVPRLQAGVIQVEPGCGGATADDEAAIDRLRKVFGPGRVQVAWPAPVAEPRWQGRDDEEIAF